MLHQCQYILWCQQWQKPSSERDSTGIDERGWGIVWECGEQFVKEMGVNKEILWRTVGRMVTDWLWEKEEAELIKGKTTFQSWVIVWLVSVTKIGNLRGKLVWQKADTCFYISRISTVMTSSRAFWHSLGQRWDRDHKWDDADNYTQHGNF